MINTADEYNQEMEQEDEKGGYQRLENGMGINENKTHLKK